MPLAYLITFSARIITTGGIVRPSAFAVFRLIISSNFVGCSTLEFWIFDFGFSIVGSENVCADCKCFARAYLP
jgi:hypothetical protein